MPLQQEMTTSLASVGHRLSATIRHGLAGKAMASKDERDIGRTGTFQRDAEDEALAAISPISVVMMPVWCCRCGVALKLRVTHGAAELSLHHQQQTEAWLPLSSPRRQQPASLIKSINWPKSPALRCEFLGAVTPPTHAAGYNLATRRRTAMLDRFSVLSL